MPPTSCGGPAVVPSVTIPVPGRHVARRRTETPSLAAAELRQPTKMSVAVPAHSSAWVVRSAEEASDSSPVPSNAGRAASPSRIKIGVGAQWGSGERLRAPCGLVARNALIAAGLLPAASPIRPAVRSRSSRQARSAQPSLLPEEGASHQHRRLHVTRLRPRRQ